jgi:hypothetical protein
LKFSPKIEDEEDTAKWAWILVAITAGLTGVGAVLEWQGVNGALVASSGVVVAITTPIFTSVLSQMADFAASVRLLLFHYRTEQSLAKEVGIISFKEFGKEAEREALRECERKIAEYQEHSESLNRGTQRLVWSQSLVIGFSAIVAAFGGYVVSFSKCGNYSC